MEPKLVIAYVSDDKSRRVRSERALYDGRLGDADAVSDALIAELLLRGAAKAREIIVTGDGAPSMWNRVTCASGLGRSQVAHVVPRGGHQGVSRLLYRRPS